MYCTGLESLRCPECGGELELEGAPACLRCGRGAYDERFGILDLMMPSDPLKPAIAEFWGDLYQQWYAVDDDIREAQQFRRELEELERLLRVRRHLAVVEVTPSELAGRDVLEIGSGAGAHSALFAAHGARVTAVDLTPERVRATAKKLKLIQGGSGTPNVALRADAERLPFADESFDVVYSNGVLHHTSDTRKAVSEAIRVLRPGGQLAMMLYSRHSAMYWSKLVPRAVVTMQLFGMPEAYWVGRLTEGRPRRSGPNPITRVYSKRQLLQLLDGCEVISLRNNGFTYSQLSPLPFGERLRDAALRALGHESIDAGRLLYGRPFIPETRTELMLGRHVGFGWNVKARKR